MLKNMMETITLLLLRSVGMSMPACGTLYSSRDSYRSSLHLWSLKCAEVVQSYLKPALIVSGRSVGRAARQS
jgi:hypothetical protein